MFITLKGELHTTNRFLVFVDVHQCQSDDVEDLSFGFGHFLVELQCPEELSFLEKEVPAVYEDLVTVGAVGQLQ